jgi:hypothetical protein
VKDWLGVKEQQQFIVSNTVLVQLKAWTRLSVHTFSWMKQQASALKESLAPPWSSSKPVKVSRPLWSGVFTFLKRKNCWGTVSTHQYQHVKSNQNFPSSFAGFCPCFVHPSKMSI